MKPYRQAAILELVDREPVQSQEALRARLRARGIDVTQATLSRDIKELGLVKQAADGAYRRPGSATPVVGAGNEQVLRRAVAEYLRGVDRSQQLIVLRTDAGQAQPLAIALDRARVADIVGTIAGDDTILVVARDHRRAAALAKRLEQLARR